MASATSTDAERAFSRGGLTVSKLRHSLYDESTRAATVFGSWAESPELIPEREIIEMFKKKYKRAGSKGNGKSKDTRHVIDDDIEIVVDTDNADIDSE